MDIQRPDVNIDPTDFDITSLEDEIHADRQCTELLIIFAKNLAEKHRVDALDAGRLAHGADPFLRDFLISDRRENLFNPSDGRVRQYAGHFYIVKTLEPNRRELADMLEGIEAFYRFSNEQGWTSDERLTAICKECTAIEEYSQRIEDFWNLKDDGFLAWRDEIPIH